MGRVRIIKKDGQAYLKLPNEFAELEEMEVFALRDGYYLLSVPLESVRSPRQETKALTESEKLMLKKLLDVKFQNRTPKNLDKTLKEDEKDLLGSLIKKGFVNIFKSNKYPDGVYNIKDNVYPLLKGIEVKSARTETAPKNEKTEGTKIPNHDTENKKPVTGESSYFVISDQKQAYEFSQQLKKSGRDKDMICLKGFDGRFYAVNKKYFLANNEKIKEALDGSSNLAAVTKACNLELDACRAMLIILADRGDVIEKKKDVFVLV